MSSPSVAKSGGFLDTIRTVVWAVLIALVIRTLLFEPFNIPSGSMIPNLLIGDYLFVSKYTYGYSRHSVPFSPPLFPGRLPDGAPERGDIAVFKLPLDNKTDYIKRIIGLPGDRIQVQRGVLQINGRAIQRERVEDFVYDEGLRGIRVPQYVETLPNGRKYRIIEIQGDQGGLDNTDVYTVPPGHYFAMGDNRDNSQDSRVLSAVGFVPVENLVGKAQFLFFSHNGAARFWEVWKWPLAIRFSRLLRGIS